MTDRDRPTPKDPLPAVRAQHPKLDQIFDSVGEGAVRERQDRPHRTTITELPAARPAERKGTLTDFPAPPASVRVPADENAPGSLSGDQNAVLRKALEAERQKTREAEARARELERQARVRAETDSPASFPPNVEPRAEPPPQQPAVEEAKAPTPAAWKAAVFRVLVGLGAVLTAAATILGVRANTAIEPKVETQSTRTKVVETTADALNERVSKLEALWRAEKKRRQCVEAQLRDAVARGTGHVVTSLPSTEVLWTEQNAPKAEPRVIWKTPTWFTAQGCDAEPAPP